MYPYDGYHGKGAYPPYPTRGKGQQKGGKQRDYEYNRPAIQTHQHSSFGYDFAYAMNKGGYGKPTEYRGASQPMDLSFHSDQFNSYQQQQQQQQHGKGKNGKNNHSATSSSSHYFSGSSGTNIYSNGSKGNNYFPSSSASKGKGAARNFMYHSSSSSSTGRKQKGRLPKPRNPGLVQMEKVKKLEFGNLHLRGFNSREGCQKLRDMITDVDDMVDPYICVRLQNVNPTSIFGPEFQAIAASYGVAMHKGFFCLTHSRLLANFCEFAALMGVRAKGTRSPKAMVMSFQTLAGKLGPETMRDLLARADELSWSTRVPERHNSVPQLESSSDQVAVDYRRGSPPASQYGISHRPVPPNGLQAAEEHTPKLVPEIEKKRATRRSPEHAMRGFGNHKLDSAPMYPPHYGSAAADDIALPYANSRTSKFHSDNDAFPGAQNAFGLDPLLRLPPGLSTPQTYMGAGTSSGLQGSPPYTPPAASGSMAAAASQRHRTPPATPPGQGQRSSSSSDDRDRGGLTIANLQAAFAQPGKQGTYFTMPVDQPPPHAAFASRQQNNAPPEPSFMPYNERARRAEDRAMEKLVQAIASSPLSSVPNSRNYSRSRSNSDGHYSNPSCGSGSIGSGNHFSVVMGEIEARMEKLSLDVESEVSMLRRAETILQKRCTRLIIVVERCTNWHNHSAIIRTAEALGVQKCYMIDAREQDKPDAGRRHKELRQHHAEAKKMSEWMHLCEFETTKECIARLRKKNFTIWATDLSQHADRLLTLPPNTPCPAGSVSVVPEKLAIVFGTEAAGCTDEMLQAADRRVYLPLRGYAESLNLSVASAMVCQTLFHMDPSLVGSISSSQKEELRKEWFPRIIGKEVKDLPSQLEKREKIKEINRRIQISKTSMSTKSSASIGYADEMNCLKSLKNEMNTLQKEVDDFAVKLAEKYIKNPPKPLGDFDLRRSDEERASKSRTLTADNLRQLEAENK